MKEFNLEIDATTSYMKVFRSIGVIGLILFTTFLILDLYKGNEINWLNTISSYLYASFFLFFPEISKRQSLTFNGEGIQRHNYNTYWGEKNEFEWEKVSELTLRKNKIVLKNKVGASEKIKLPVYTHEQMLELKEYLEEIAKTKDFEFKEK